MERLTMIDGCGNDELAHCMNCGLGKAGENLENCGMCEEGWQRALRRLAAYEDTGLEPEEIADLMKRWERTVEIAGLCKKGGIDHLLELKKAEQDGRLVALPCKVGSTVYTTHWWKDVKEKCTDSNGKPFYRTVSKKIIKKERFDPFGPHYAWLGETVFLTREEAEAALAQKGGEG